MLHFGSFEIRTDIFVFLLCIIFILIQFFLCFKAKKKIIRRIPIYLSFGLLIVFGAFGFIFDDWDRLGFFFLAVCAAFLLIGCGIGWGIWIVIKKMKMRRAKDEY